MVLSWDLPLLCSSDSSFGEEEGDGLTSLDSQEGTLPPLGPGLPSDISLDTILTFAFSV